MDLSSAWEQVIPALAIWREARGCSQPAMNGVWWVIRNRASDPKNRWPKQLSEVVLEPWQFSSFNKPTAAQLKAPALDLDPNIWQLPMRANEVDWEAWQRVLIVVGNPLGGDPTNGATAYHSFPVGDPRWPSWATKETHTVDIGPFHFFSV